MTEDHWVQVAEVNGMLQAEVFRGMFEAQGISVWITQEGAGRAMGLTIGLLGVVQILVPSHDEEQAKELLNQYYAGELMDRDSTAQANNNDSPADGG